MEPRYPSKGEAQVGGLLDRHGIPFFYEQPTLVYDRGRYRVWHPDFTLPGYDLIVEYAGQRALAGYRRQPAGYLRPSSYRRQYP